MHIEFRISDDIVISDEIDSEAAMDFISYGRWLRDQACPKGEPQIADAPKADPKGDSGPTRFQLEIMRDRGFEPWEGMTKREAASAVRDLMAGKTPIRQAKLPQTADEGGSKPRAGDGPATDKQIATMRRFGIPFDDGISSKEAHALITESIRKASMNPRSDT